MFKWMLICLATALPALAQQKEIVRVEAEYDPSAVAELYSKTPIGLTVKYADSSERKTAGLLGGDIRWNQVQVQTPHGEVRNGVLTFSRNAARPDNYKLRLQVTFSGYPGKSWESDLQLPYLTGIRFRHYADSLKRGIHFYLNVEGMYNSGKIYPLDTTRIRFASDKGTIIGQDLLIPLADSLTRQIHVTAVYRGDAAMRVESEIPVKQLPDDESLIIRNADEVSKPSSKKKKRQ
ncbi:hypothetical protein WJU16_18765 [Chitinophaga pollutisoli]|uniref:Uncharacterized protein n=1 Tax=Chitinophaga pollutisoli TaxID=3133966 RepID=A0ABZ2YM73_9BACT